MAAPSRRHLLAAGGLLLSAGAARSETASSDRGFPPPAAVSESVELGLVHPIARAKVWEGEAGWFRAVTRQDWPAAHGLAGAQIRLLSGGVRAPQWRTAAEFGVVLAGQARLTAVDHQGRRAIADLAEGDVWSLPGGIPHALQGIGEDGCELLVAFDDGECREGEGPTLAEWLRVTPREMLGREFDAPDGVPGAPAHPPLFLAPLPRSVEEELAASKQATVPSPYHFPLTRVRPIEGKGGWLRIADEENFRGAGAMCAAMVELKPGGMREMHWHPNADEWQFYISGSGRLSTFAGTGRDGTALVGEGDLGYVARGAGHAIENTGEEPLRWVEIFNDGVYADVSLRSWLANMPAVLAGAATGLDAGRLEGLPKNKTPILPV